MTFKAEGREEVRYPVVLARGEKLEIKFKLPAAGSIPPGYVYIPPGRFYFGSSADELVRAGTLTTVPMHQRTTEGYLIGKTEVTIADFLEYVKSQPAADRTKIPALSSEQNGLFLKELPDRKWHLKIHGGIEDASSNAEGVLKYSNRKTMNAEEWARLPISAVNVLDAESYLSWIARSGRLPNARLCRETEWERAGRGADDRQFPHGDRLDAKEANFDETYGQNGMLAYPDIVGSFTQSMSPFGLLDMSGNIFEWTVSDVAKSGFLARSGSFWNPKFASNLSNRSLMDAGLRDSQVGFRVCASITIQ